MTLSSKRLMILAAKAYLAKDYKRSGKLWMTAMSQPGSFDQIKQMEEEYNTELRASTSAYSQGYENDLDLPLGDYRYQQREELALRYPKHDPVRYKDPKDQDIPLLLDGTTNPTPVSAEEDFEDDEDEAHDDDEFNEDMYDDPDNFPPSISSGESNENIDSSTNIGKNATERSEEDNGELEEDQDEEFDEDSKLQPKTHIEPIERRLTDQDKISEVRAANLAKLKKD